MSHDLDAMEAELSEHTGTTRDEHRGGEPPIAPRAHDRSRRRSLLVGLVLGLLVAGAGLVYAAAHPTSWSTHREVVVVPASDTDVSSAAALYDSLSRGQVVATVAEIYGQPRWHAKTPDVTVSAGAVPPSAVVQITSTGTDQAAVTQSLDQVITSGTSEVNETIAPYRAVVLGDKAPEPTAVGLGRAVLAVVALLGGLLVGALTTGFLRRAPRTRER